MEKVKSLIVEINAPSVETILNTLSFNKPKVVKNGTLQLETASPTSTFWTIWKTNKNQLKDLGISVVLDKGNWVINKWTKLGVLPSSITNSNSSATNSNSISLIPSVTIPDEIGSKLLYFQPSSVIKLVNAMRVNGSALDASECGTGKTHCALATAKILNKKVLVVCTKAAIPGWERAAEYHTVESYTINYEMVKTGKTGFGTWEKKQIQYSNGTTNTVETFTWTLSEGFMIVFDECHKIKNRDTINSKIAIAAKLQGVPILLLSATAASNPLEMKALGFILDLFPLKGYWKWAENYGVKKGRFGMEFSGGGYHLQNIHNSIFHIPVPKGSRLRIKDIPNFPETLIISEALDFDEANPLIQAAYDEMQDEIERLRKRTSEDTSACILTEILRARQKVELLKIPTLAEKAFDLVQEGKAVPIFLSFKESIQSLSNKLNTTCIIDGDHVGKIREENRLRFQRRTERIIICSILAGGESIDLDDQTGEFPTDAIICPDFSAIRIKQAIGRTQRSKTMSKSIQRFCFAAGTIEERARQRVLEKARNIETLNDGDLTCGLNL